MTKIAEDAAMGLPLNDERTAEKPKRNRHVTIAINHMQIRRLALIEKKEDLDLEIEELDKAIEALG